MPLDELMAKRHTSSLRLVELMRLFSKDTVGVRVAVLCGLLFAEIALRLVILLTSVCLMVTVSYGLAHGII